MTQTSNEEIPQEFLCSRKEERRLLGLKLKDSSVMWWESEF
jgi:hypothetical protein